jgi:hypothetical protein
MVYELALGILGPLPLLRHPKSKQRRRFFQVWLPRRLPRSADHPVFRVSNFYSLPDTKCSSSWRCTPLTDQESWIPPRKKNHTPHPCGALREAERHDLHAWRGPLGVSLHRNDVNCLGTPEYFLYTARELNASLKMAGTSLTRASGPLGFMLLPLARQGD